MKFIVFLVLSLVATSLATPLSSKVRSQRDVISTTPSSECADNQDSGLGGLLAQVGNLLGNIITNIGRIRLRSLVTGDNGVLNLLSNLLAQVQELLNNLLSGTNLSDDDANQIQSLLSDLLKEITGLLDNLLGGGEGSAWTCANSGGILGGLLSSALGAVGNLTGSWSHDGGLLTNVLKIVLQLLGSVLGILL